jgi:hypothetical protein
VSIGKTTICRLQIVDFGLGNWSSNPKQAPIFKAPNSKQYHLENKGLKFAKQLKKATNVLNIGYWDFEFVWNL